MHSAGNLRLIMGSIRAHFEGVLPKGGFGGVGSAEWFAGEAFDQEGHSDRYQALGMWSRTPKQASLRQIALSKSAAAVAAGLRTIRASKIRMFWMAAIR